MNQPCIIPAGDLLTACPRDDLYGSGPCEVVSRALFASGGCTLECAAQVANLVFSEGCCAASIAAAQARWLDDVTGNQFLGQHFRVDWGLGRVEEFRAPSACGGGGMVNAVCRAAQCGAGDEIWPTACCNATAAGCANGGVQAELGACNCACPDGWTGSKCTGRAPHVRLGLLLAGMSRRSWVLGGAVGFRALIMAQLEPVALEYDGAPQQTTTNGIGNRRGATETAYGSGISATSVLEVQMRLLGETDDDALLLLMSITQIVSSKV